MTERLWADYDEMSREDLLLLVQVIAGTRDMYRAALELCESRIDDLSAGRPVDLERMREQIRGMLEYDQK
jgi:hypothetical protein